MLTVSSLAFADGGWIPAEYCAVGVEGASDSSLPLAWTGVPDETRSILVTMIDHHPVARMWVHWVVGGIPPTVTEIPARASGALDPPMREYENTNGKPGYGGPKPPVGSGDHDYVVTVYALDIDDPDLPDKPSSAEIARAIDGHVLAMGSITGFFGR